MESEKRFGLYVEKCGHEYDGSYPKVWCSCRESGIFETHVAP